MRDEAFFRTPRCFVSFAWPSDGIHNLTPRLLQDQLLTQTQRLVGFYLLYDIYRMLVDCVNASFARIACDPTLSSGA